MAPAPTVLQSIWACRGREWGEGRPVWAGCWALLPATAPSRGLACTSCPAPGTLASFLQACYLLRGPGQVSVAAAVVAQQRRHVGLQQGKGHEGQEAVGPGALGWRVTAQPLRETRPAMGKTQVTRAGRAQPPAPPPAHTCMARSKAAVWAKESRGSAGARHSHAPASTGARAAGRDSGLRPGRRAQSRPCASSVTCRHSTGGWAGLGVSSRPPGPGFQTPTHPWGQAAARAQPGCDTHSRSRCGQPARAAGKPAREDGVRAAAPRCPHHCARRVEPGSHVGAALTWAGVSGAACSSGSRALTWAGDRRCRKPMPSSGTTPLQACSSCGSTASGPAERSKSASA